MSRYSIQSSRFPCFPPKNNTTRKNDTTHFGREIGNKEAPVRRPYCPFCLVSMRILGSGVYADLERSHSAVVWGSKRMVPSIRVAGRVPFATFA